MITEGVAIKVPQVMHEHSGRCAVGVMQSPNCNYLSPALQCLQCFLCCQVSDTLKRTHHSEVEIAALRCRNV